MRTDHVLIKADIFTCYGQYRMMRWFFSGRRDAAPGDLVVLPEIGIHGKINQSTWLSSIAIFAVRDVRQNTAIPANFSVRLPSTK